MAAPILNEPIPPQIINERAAFGPVDLKPYFTFESARFSAELSDGQPLPRGMICTEDGLLTGIPAKDTIGAYEVIITGENSEGKVTAPLAMTIKPSLAGEDILYIDQLKSQIWQALDQNLPPPELTDLLNRPISDIEIYYLMERWGMLRIWDAFNLDPPSHLKPLQLEGVSPHYQVYDGGSCLIGAPKDLFSHERTLQDALETSRAMAREVYERNWTVELVGFHKMTRAAWIEIQKIGDLRGRQLEIVNYQATPDDIKLYRSEIGPLLRGTPE